MNLSSDGNSSRLIHFPTNTSKSHTTFLCAENNTAQGHTRIFSFPFFSSWCSYQYLWISTVRTVFSKEFDKNRALLTIDSYFLEKVSVTPVVLEHPNTFVQFVQYQILSCSSEVNSAVLSTCYLQYRRLRVFPVWNHIHKHHSSGVRVPTHTRQEACSPRQRCADCTGLAVLEWRGCTERLVCNGNSHWRQQKLPASI